MEIDKILFVSDLDGTLLNSNAQVSKNTKFYLNKMISNGLHFSVATAHTATSALNILYGLQCNDPIILLDGVLIYDVKNKQYIKIYLIPSNTVAEIITIMKTLGVTGIIYVMDNGIERAFYESVEHQILSEFIARREKQFHERYEKLNSFSDIMLCDITYLSFFDTYENIKSIHAALQMNDKINCIMYQDVYVSDVWGLDIHSSTASKAGGINYLKEKYGYQQVICFGDEVNDKSMFEMADIQVAVGNAKNELKAMANEICDTNSNDGVLKWIMQYLKLL